MKDAFGRELKVGDQVSHCGRVGSSMHVSVLEVVAFAERKAGYYGKDVMVAKCKRLHTTGWRKPSDKLHTYESTYLVKLEAL